LLVSLIFLVVAITINSLAGAYATERASSAVTDIVLSNIPVLDVDVMFVYGPITFWLIIIGFLLVKPRQIPFVLKSTALFVVIRSVFLTLTHIGPFPDHIAVDSFSFFSHVNFFIFNSGADLFFSGHTGLPFMLALIFWNDRHMRYFCLASAVFFGVVVLLGHLHYSIDVLSAFFITYTIFHIALKAFPKDRLLFLDATNA
jgi:hypothetical protein